MTFREMLLENRGKRLLIGGHRGHLSDIRENTIENYEEMGALPVSHIELDLQLSRDGVPMVYHDFDLAERSPLKGSVRDYTAEELQAAFRIDTLDETLRWCSENGRKVAFELKCRTLSMYGDMPSLSLQLADKLSEYDFSSQCFVFGTDYRSLKLIHERNPQAMLGAIVPFIPSDPVGFMRDLHADIYLCYLDNLCTEIIDMLHAAGLYADGSVVNSRERLKEALRLNVDLIESDYPAQILKEYETILKTEGTDASRKEQAI